MHGFRLGRLRLWSKILLTVFAFTVLIPVPATAAPGSQTYTFLTKWGSAGTSDGQFSGPMGILVSSAGEVKVVDQNCRVQTFDRQGNFISKWGSSGSGSGQLQDPYDMTSDGAGNLYIVENSLCRVQKFSPGGNILLTFGSSGAGNTQFSSPRGIAVDAAGNIYVGDCYNSCIKKFDSVGNFITKWGTSGSGDGQFSALNRIALSPSGFLYVTEVGNNRVQKFTLDGQFVTKFGGGGTADGKMSAPQGIGIDQNGYVYVLDTGNRRVQKFDANGNFITKWGTNGSGDGQFYNPLGGIAIDKYGVVYVTDYGNKRIEAFYPEGKVLVVPVDGAKDVGLMTVKHGWSVKAGTGTKLSTRTVQAVEIYGNKAYIILAEGSQVAKDETIEITYKKPGDPDKALIDQTGNYMTITSPTVSSTNASEPPVVNFITSTVESSGKAVKVYFDGLLDTNCLTYMTKNHGWTVKKSTVGKTTYSALKVTSVQVSANYVMVNVYSEDNDIKNVILNGEGVKIAYKQPSDADKRIRGANGTYVNSIAETSITNNASALAKPILPDFTDKTVNYCVYDKVYLQFGHVADGNYAVTGWTIKEGTKVQTIQSINVNNGVVTFTLDSSITENTNVTIAYIAQKTGNYLRSIDSEGAYQIDPINTKTIYWKAQ